MSRVYKILCIIDVFVNIYVCALNLEFCNVYERAIYVSILTRNNAECGIYLLSKTQPLHTEKSF